MMSLVYSYLFGHSPICKENMSNKQMTFVWSHSGHVPIHNPMDQSEYPILRSSLERLVLNDSSVTISPDSSSALGQANHYRFLSCSLIGQ